MSLAEGFLRHLGSVTDEAGFTFEEPSGIHDSEIDPARHVGLFALSTFPVAALSQAALDPSGLAKFNPLTHYPAAFLKTLAISCSRSAGMYLSQKLLREEASATERALASACFAGSIETFLARNMERIQMGGGKVKFSKREFLALFYTWIRNNSSAGANAIGKESNLKSEEVMALSMIISTLTTHINCALRAFTISNNKGFSECLAEVGSNMRKNPLQFAVMAFSRMLSSALIAVQCHELISYAEKVKSDMERKTIENSEKTERRVESCPDNKQIPKRGMLQTAADLSLKPKAIKFSKAKAANPSESLPNSVEINITAEDFYRARSNALGKKVDDLEATLHKLKEDPNTKLIAPKQMEAGRESGFFEL